MDFKRRELKINLYGEDYVLTYPTKAQAEKLAKGEDGVEAITYMLSECGLPREQVQNMEVEHVEQLVQELLPAKKK